MQLFGGTVSHTSRTEREIPKKDSRMLSGGKGVDGERSEHVKSESKNQRNLSSLENASKGVTIENSAEARNTTKIGYLKNFWKN